MNIETDEKIDVHRIKRSYEIALERFKRDTTICKENKFYILDYLNACNLGKTIFEKQKKKIREKRLLKYLYTLQNINKWLGNKDFKQITQQDIESFITLLEGNKLTALNQEAPTTVTYAAWTQRDYKMCLRKFYKWLLGEGRQFPSLVSWIDTTIDKTAPPSLSLDEIKKCVDYASSIRGKAICWTLFETGARAEEFLNIRLKHAEDKGSHFVVRIDYPKTFKRSLPVFEGTNYLREWVKLHPKQNDPNAQLFPISYEALLKFLKRLGRRALGKRITPQLMRDSFATWLASKKVGRYQMCKLMGWAMSSDMPDRYIDRTGVVEHEAIEAIRGDDLNKVERENSELKSTLKRLETQSNELRERLEKREKIDEFLTALLKDEQFGKVLIERVKKKGLGEKLLRL
jgi:site-specific recombinase XerD